MTNSLQALIDKFQGPHSAPAPGIERDDSLYAVSARDPSYSLLLTRNGSSEAPWRVTSFRGKEPVGRREYDVLEGRGPTQNALQEFATEDMQVSRRE